MFHSDVLHWKCFAPHPFWDGSRGYILRYKGAIAAFGCVVPCRFLTAAGTISACDVIDWAARKAVPGAGAMLYRHIQTLTTVMLNIGGTAEARAVLPKMGFDLRCELHSYVRTLRPARHLLRSGPKDWKAPLRLARDYTSLARSAPQAFQSRCVENFPDANPAIFPDPTITGEAVCARTPELLDYFLACPAAAIEAHIFDQPPGYFLLSRIGNQCRIADLWIRSSEPSQWAAAYVAATRAVLEDPAATQVTTAVSTPTQIEALRQAGYRPSHIEPVFVHDPGSLLPPTPSLSFLENDAAYWSAPEL
jgi:hypothetical protein